MCCVVVYSDQLWLARHTLLYLIIIIFFAKMNAIFLIFNLAITILLKNLNLNVIMSFMIHNLIKIKFNGCVISRLYLSLKCHTMCHIFSWLLNFGVAILTFFVAAGAVYGQILAEWQHG